MAGARRRNRGDDCVGGGTVVDLGVSGKTSLVVLPLDARRPTGREGLDFS